MRWRLDQNGSLRRRLSETYGRNLRLFASLVAERHEMTSGHCERVAQNAVVLGTRLHLPQHDLKLLYWTGGGYPRGLHGHNIPLFGRILALVDVFEALTCHRPYRDAMPPEWALAIVKEGVGTQFDPDLAKVFLEAHNEGALTIQTEPEPFYGSFVTSILREPNDPSKLFSEHLQDAAP